MEQTLSEKRILEKGYSLAEEIANSITHGIGALLSIAALVILVTYATLQSDMWRIVSFSIYGTSLILLYLASTLYHSFPQPHIKRLLKVFDHCAIYLLIAGTYTPFLLVSIRGIMGWTLFSIIWLLAISGITLKLAFRNRYHGLSVATYVLMGWLAVFASRELAHSLSGQGLGWVVAGGITYTLGVFFYLVKRIPFNHAIWHLFVLGGSICHFFAVYWYVLPQQN
ncbi:hypothetical protein CI610_02474 [invertebrate metagenome]|uniref:Hemolysin-III related n=1 Tax=invertebrate metagenome TaxID=1711999 RepID=A0A2H9T5T4_9ZZZZ